MKGALTHVHSMYSVDDSAQTPEEIVIQAKNLGYQTVCLSDHGTLLGIPPFLDACEKHQVKPIVGIEMYLSARRHLILYSLNEDGYKDISKATRDAWNFREETKTKKSIPILTDELMEKYFKGNNNVIATTACIGGPIASILLQNLWKKRKIEKILSKVQNCSEGYHLWMDADRVMEFAVRRIKELEKEEKEYKPYLSKSYMKKYQKKLENENQISIFELCGETANDEDMFSPEEAKKIINQIKKEVDDLKKEKKEAQQKKKQYKKEKESYAKAVSETEGIVLETEDDLYLKAKERLLYLKSIFPNFYVEIQNHGMEEELYVMPLLVKLAKETDTPLMAANDAHITDCSEDSIRARQILRYNYFKKAEAVTDTEREMYIKSPDQLYDALCKAVSKEAAKEAVENTDVFNRFDLKITHDKHYPAIANGEALFDQLLEEEKARMIKNKEWNDQYESRLIHEVKIIKEMGFVDYHLIVRDFCNMAKKLGVVPKEDIESIPVDFHKIDQWIEEKGYDVGIGIGPGRGSAAGSLVCYMLKITNIDPLKYHLLFERFLNPERVSMPDIDSDIKTSLRPTIIQYLKWKYGENAVCSISTEMTYAAKNALQSAGRNRASEIYDFDTTLSNADKKAKKQQASKLGYQMSDLFETGSLADNQELILNTFQSEEAKQVFHDACLIEGKIATTSVHAGGVIISDNDDICEYVPLHWVEKKQVWAAQCDMIKAEEYGLLKMDVLGLSTLDIISDCLHLIKKHHGISIDLNEIKEEEEIFSEIYTKGNTTSVFQFESNGMKQMLRRYEPKSIDDLILLNACFRPGPLQYLDKIIETKKTGKREESCLTKIPQLQDILANTYGYPIYQEQIMKIFQVLAGYSLGGADIVRRYMSKKKEDKLAIEKEAFLYGDEKRNIPGCKKNGIDLELAEELFEQMMDFAKYGFNKSHAASYAVLSYQVAWLKYHYPAELFTAMFNNEDQEKYQMIKEECELFGVQVLQPDINRSKYDFTIEGDHCIRFGLIGIKGIADRNIANQIGARKYDSFSEFLSKFCIQETLINKGGIESLVNAGCFDELFPNREKLLEFYQSVSERQKEILESDTLYQEILKKEAEKKDCEKDEKYNLESEMEYLGVFVSIDPLKNYGNDEDYGCIPLNQLKDGDCSVYGYVTESSIGRDKKDQERLILKIKGKKGKITVMTNERRFIAKAKEYVNQVITVSGKIRGDYIFARQIENTQKLGKTWFVRVDTEAKYKNFVKCVREEKGKEKPSERLVCCTSVYYNPKTNQFSVCVPQMMEMKVSEKMIHAVHAVSYQM